MIIDVYWHEYRRPKALCTRLEEGLLDALAEFGHMSKATPGSYPADPLVRQASEPMAEAVLDGVEDVMRAWAVQASQLEAITPKWRWR